VLEFLLTNHPLDCPVCDKGGECPLQDNAYSFGPGESRFVEEKRHYEKPIPISDLVHLDRERCILCDRCTRFASEVAGDPLIHFIGRGSGTQVNTFPDHPFSSYFSGNTVQICPVGALTASPYRFKARPWDLDAVESTSTVDATGARVVLQSSQNKLMRVLGVDSEAVNWSWLSDKDRFAYEATNSEERLTDPLIKTGDEFRPARWTDASKAAALALRTEPERVAVIGGSRLSLESQYAWSKLVKGVLGTDHVDAQLGDGLPAALSLGLPRATIADACQPGGIIVLMAADPKEELASLYLRLRHAVVEDGATLIEITPRDTSLSDLAEVRLRTTPGTVGQVMAAIAADEVDEAVGAVEPLQLRRTRSLLSGKRPVTVVYGRSNLAESARYTADAVGGLRRICPDATYLPASRRGNINGALEMGLTPGFLPGGARNRDVFIDTWAATPDFEGKDTDGILRAAVDGAINTLVLLGADPIEDFPDSKLVREAFDHVETIIAVDGFINSSSGRADIVLPAAMFGEADGTFCNLEGRLSPLSAKVTSPGLARPDWMIAAELSAALGIDLGFNSLAELRAEMSGSVPSLADVDWDGLVTADDGPLLRPERNWDLEFGEAAPAPPSSNYGLRLVVDRKLWDLGTMIQNSPSLASLPMRAELRLSPADVHLMNLAEHDFVTVDHGDISFDLPFVIDPAVAPKTAWLPARLPGFDVRELLSAGRSITNIRVRIPEGEQS
jgi:NADH-quinone oxidoreductase subunit G